jgi:hypothetical protein
VLLVHKEYREYKVQLVLLMDLQDQAEAVDRLVQAEHQVQQEVLGQQAHLVQQEVLVQQAHQVQQVPLVHQESQGHQEAQDHREQEEALDHQEAQEHPEQEEALDHQGHQDQQEVPVQQEPLLFLLLTKHLAELVRSVLTLLLLIQEKLLLVGLK